MNVPPLKTGSGSTLEFPRQVWVVLAAWLAAIGLAEMLSLRLTPPGGGPALEWWQVFASAVSAMLLWLGVGYLALQVARHIPIRRGMGLGDAALIMAAIAGAVVVQIVFYYNVIAFTPWLPDTEWGHMWRTTPRRAMYIAYAFSSAYGLVYFIRYRQRELEASRYEAEFAQAHLAMLKAQLNPHFLFNTLHAISALVRLDPPAAERTIAQLSDLLRSSLAHSRVQEVTLAEEMEFLRPYVEIAKTRFGDRLEIDVRSPEELTDAIVPHLILQPLVENAIRHGIEPKEGTGHVALSVDEYESRLRIEVRDDGVGLSHPRGSSHSGIGLSNIRARLERLYGDQHRFHLRSVEGRGVSVTVEIPLRFGSHRKVALTTRLDSV